MALIVNCITGLVGVLLASLSRYVERSLPLKVLLRNVFLEGTLCAGFGVFKLVMDSSECDISRLIGLISLVFGTFLHRAILGSAMLVVVCEPLGIL